MRKITMLNRVSIDGFFASLNDANFGMDWFVGDPEVDKAVRSGEDPVDTLVLGGVTYRGFERSWTPFLEDPHAPEGSKAIAQALTAQRKVVFSRSMQEASWANTELYGGEPAEVVRRMKAEEGRGILIMGSGTIVRQLANEALIDDYVFIVTPVVAGQGKPLFAEVHSFPLTLKETRAFPSGNVVLRYGLKN